MLYECEHCKTELNKCSDEKGDYLYCHNVVCNWDEQIRIEKGEWKKIQARRKVADIEKEAERRYLKNVDWNDIIDNLEDDEKKELNEAHKIAYKEDYPLLGEYSEETQKQLK